MMAGKFKRNCKFTRVPEINKKTTAVLITSDKAYQNLEIKRGYVENDILKGADPYGASKSSADIAINSYFQSFFFKKK